MTAAGGRVRDRRGLQPAESLLTRLRNQFLEDLLSEAAVLVV